MDVGVAVILQQATYLLEVEIEIADADMLHHADRNHTVEFGEHQDLWGPRRGRLSCGKLGWYPGVRSSPSLPLTDTFAAAA